MSEIPSRHSAGGRARAAKLSPEERKAIASKAAKARWAKDRPVVAVRPSWAELEAEGWRRISVRLSPSVAARLKAFMAPHSDDADEAIRLLLDMRDAVKAQKPLGLSEIFTGSSAETVDVRPGPKPVRSRFNPQPKPGKR